MTGAKTPKGGDLDLTPAKPKAAQTGSPFAKEKISTIE